MNKEEIIKYNLTYLIKAENNVSLNLAISNLVRGIPYTKIYFSYDDSGRLVAFSLSKNDINKRTDLFKGNIKYNSNFTLNEEDYLILGIELDKSAKKEINQIIKKTFENYDEIKREERIKSEPKVANAKTQGDIIRANVRLLEKTESFIDKEIQLICNGDKIVDIIESEDIQNKILDKSFRRIKAKVSEDGTINLIYDTPINKIISIIIIASINKYNRRITKPWYRFW